MALVGMGRQCNWATFGGGAGAIGNPTAGGRIDLSPGLDLEGHQFVLHLGCEHADVVLRIVVQDLNRCGLISRGPGWGRAGTCRCIVGGTKGAVGAFAPWIVPMEKSSSKGNTTLGFAYAFAPRLSLDSPALRMSFTQS